MVLRADVRTPAGVLPALIGGDFNTAESTAAIGALLAAGFVDAFRAANPTAPGPTVWQRIDAPEPTVFRRVDYVFLFPGTRVGARVVSSRIVLNRPRRRGDRVLWPSDHYGVFAEVGLVPNAATSAAGR